MSFSIRQNLWCAQYFMTHVDQVQRMSDVPHSPISSPFLWPRPEQGRRETCGQVPRRHLILLFMIVDQVQMRDQATEKSKVGRRE